MSNDPIQLPACSKCRLRKVRCDRQAPKCGNCAKSNAACIVVDVATGKQYARDYIRQLEEEEEHLKDQLEARSSNNSATLHSDRIERTPRGPPTGETVASHSGFVGDGSGLGFLHHILSDEKWQQHRPRILEQLADRPSVSKQAIVPHDLPSLSEAEQLLENYFSRFHIHHTFLLRQELLDVFYKLYGQPPPSDAITPIINGPNAQDKFRLLLVFAISATTRYRAGLCTQHPYGYYLAAQSYLVDIPLIQDTEALQNLLLIARFGMYHHIGCSLWEISQVCMRQCVELRLHERPLKPLDPLKEQHQRRIFWECYVLDRYSSGILGRPFAIMEEDISVSLPVNEYDDHIAEAGPGALDVTFRSETTAITEISIFIVFIQLRRISSRIHNTFYTDTSARMNSGGGTNHAELHSVGSVYATFVQFKSELDAWRSTVPTFGNPRSLYERADWHDFMYYKDMLLLTRGVLHSLPSALSSSSSSIRELLTTCYHSAARVIQLYGDLMDKGAITWTRSYFQVIFTAGLTIIYCISLGVLVSNTTDIQDHNEAGETITRCTKILSYFKEQMPDAGSFAVVFDLLKEECINGTLGISALVPGHGITDGVNPFDTTLGLPPRDNDVPNNDWPFVGTHSNGLEVNIFGTDFGLTDDLMTQLEAGLGEYAWGTLPMESSFWNHIVLD